MRNRAVRQIAVCAVLQIILLLIFRLASGGVYRLEILLTAPERQMIDREGWQLETDVPEVVSVGQAQIRNGRLVVPIRGAARGETFLTLSSGGVSLSHHSLAVDRFRTVYDRSTGGFSGDSVSLITFTVFCFIVSAIMLWNFAQARGPAFYSYQTIYFAGFSIFAVTSGLLMLFVTVSHLRNPAQYPMMEAYSVINGASMRYLQLTTPLVLFFAAAMAVSNIALLRHERPRVQNALGLLVSLLMAAGVALGWYFVTRDLSGSEAEVRTRETLHNVYATVFVYFECMLAGSVICGYTAAKRQPQTDKDYIIILGCYFRRDGSLPPLLRGRADRAIAFWRAQKEQTGREALFIPSGGQGADETMPEAEAIRRYLLSQGVPDRLIRVENQSANTFQNMANSRALIEEIDPTGKAVFATTNYHVFRSGVWARMAGLSAEGIGSRTKWWFWPNAFMRECVGLLQRRWKQELLLLVFMTLYFALLSVVLF